MHKNLRSRRGVNPRSELGQYYSKIDSTLATLAKAPAPTLGTLAAALNAMNVGTSDTFRWHSATVENYIRNIPN